MSLTARHRLEVIAKENVTQRERAASARLQHALQVSTQVVDFLKAINRCGNSHLPRLELQS